MLFRLITILFLSINLNFYVQSQEIDMQAIESVDMSSRNDDILERAMSEFRSSNFREALQFAQQLRGDRETESLKFYLMGLCYNRLDEYEEAISSFQNAVRLGNQAADISYEIGQAYYAINDLQQAIIHFRRSYQQGHMRSSSLYYLGHISQIYDQHREARAYFDRLTKAEREDLTLIQIAKFQSAESLLNLVRNRDDREQHIKETVLPEFETALEMSPRSQLGLDIQQRIREIKQEFGLDPNILINNRQISAKRYQLEFNQKVTYDNNITFANDQPTTEATQTDSYLLQSEIFGNRTFVYNRRYVITPQLRATKIKHTNRDEPEVYRNDSYSLRPSIQTQTEFTLLDRPASFLFDYDFDYIARDREAQKETQFFSRSHTFTIGQRFQYFSFGETTFRARKRFYRGFESALNSDTITYSADQIFLLPRNHLLIGLINFDQIRIENDTFSADALTLRADYIIPNLFQNVTFGANFTYSRTDNYNDPNKDNPDIMMMPGLNLSRTIGEHFRIRANYEYLSISSDNPINEFSKHLFSFELRVML